jgi:glyoxalase family protein
LARNTLIIRPIKVEDTLQLRTEVTAMETGIRGAHHITAIAEEPNRNIAFYTKILGLKFVKLTVNFDDPSTYHFYYGDEKGRPGTILTFFVWPGAQIGRKGPGQVTAVTFSIPEGSMSFWMDRLRRQNAPVQGLTKRFNEDVLAVEDPDGLHLELVEVPGSTATGVSKDDVVPIDHAITGFYAVTLLESACEETDLLLTDTLGFQRTIEEGNRIRYLAGPNGKGTALDVVHAPDELAGIVAVGTVHHVAWRTPDDEQQIAWRKKIVDIGLNVTPVIDRRYFKSIYFREPGGVLFEIATDRPGFAIDEEPGKLGTGLMLPPWLEAYRSRLERELPQLAVLRMGQAA